MAVQSRARLDPIMRRASSHIGSAIGQIVPAAAFVLIPLVLGSRAQHLHVPILALGVHVFGTLLVETVVLSRYVRGHASEKKVAPPFHRDALRVLRTGILARLFALGAGIAIGAGAFASSMAAGKRSEAVIGFGIVLGILVTEAVTVYATRLAVLAELAPLSALRQSVRVASRHPFATTAAYLVPGAAYVLGLAGTRFLLLAALAIGVRWLRDVWVTRLALAPTAPSAASRSSAPVAALSVVLLVALVSLCAGDAAAQVPLLVSANGTATGTGTQLVTPSAAPVSTPGASLRGTDTITPIIVARSKVDAAVARERQALTAMRQAVIHGGDTLAAEAEVTASGQALRDATAGVRTALEANEAATQLAVKREQLQVYGPEGPSTLASVGAGGSAAAGLTVGMGQGTVVGAWDSLLGLGHAVMHPLDTGKALVSVFTQPPLTHDQEIVNDVASLQRERADRLAMVDAPFDSSRKAGYLLGHDVVGPLVGGEVLGGVGGLVGRGVGRAAATDSRANALVEGAAQTIARTPYPIDVTGLAQMDGPRPVLTYSSDTPVFRVQDPSLPLTPHPSEYFQNMDYGLPSIIEKADGTRAFQSYDALFVSTDLKEITLLRQQQGYFEKGATLQSSTLGELLEKAGPGARVFVDQRLPDHSLIIAAPPK